MRATRSHAISRDAAQHSILHTNMKKRTLKTQSNLKAKKIKPNTIVTKNKSHKTSQRAAASIEPIYGDSSDSESENKLDEESVDENSLAEVQRTLAESKNVIEPLDETKSHLMEGGAEVKPGDVFYERFVKRISEDSIRAQIKSYPEIYFTSTRVDKVRCEAVGTKNAVISHELLGTILAFGAVASGQEWAVGLARDGIDHVDWLSNNTAPGELSEQGINNILHSSFAKIGGVTPHQQALSSLLLSYADIAYHRETTDNHMEIVQCYVLHALNHVYRSRLISYQNSLLVKADANAEISDQGFTRPKVLILTPLRNTAYNAIKFLCNLQSGSVLHYDTFKKRFSPGGKISVDSSKPKDYQHNFRGNVDDMFTIGITMKNDMTLSLDATNLYHADIIVASPAALRLLIGSPGDSKRNFDFLSSIDVLIVDQIDMMLMQNWSYLTLIFEHLNLKPTTVRPGMDFSRTNEWSLSNLSSHRRQTILFSEFPAPDINALFNRKYTYGKIKITSPPSEGVIERVIPQIRQTFQRLECTSDISELDDQRFKLFSEEIFPHISSTLLNRVLLFIPSYFDFLRIRELFKAEREQFCQANEYMKPHSIINQCKAFARKNMKWLLCTERCYYYNRMNIPRVRHVVFYAPPLFARFYPELLNPVVSNDATCLTLYTKFEKMQLERIVGHTRTQKMLTSNKSTFLFC